MQSCILFNLEEKKTLKMQAIIMAPYILQVGMGIHAFFEGISIGLQPNYMNTYALGLVVLVHKWAEGLTLVIILFL